MRTKMCVDLKLLFGMSACMALCMLSTYSLAAPAPAASCGMAEQNKQTVIRFYNALAQGDVDTLKALGRPDYRQHNPAYGDTLQGLVDRIHDRPARPAGAPPIPPLQFVRVIAEGDYVMLLRRMGVTPGAEPTPEAERANVDIFRLQDGKVAEHWDYSENFPRGTEPPKNNNGRF
jgi:predicted SnoaL-like aldol condensation-catalyzing enzyme